MFRKLVSNVSFSPALVGQLGFYARRLKQEEATRRIGLIFTALALVVQSFVVFTPPEPANAASANDMIYGGIKSRNDVLAAYDRDKKFRDVMNMAGITRAELAKTETRYLNNLSRGTGSKAWRSYGYHSKFSTAQGEIKHKAGDTTVYSRPHYLYGRGMEMKVLYGYSSKLKDNFAIQYSCGNLWTSGTPTPPPPPPPPPPAPKASCSLLSAIRVTDDTYKLSAKATASNGAIINNYTFTVTDSSNKTVKTIKQTSSQTSVTTAEFKLPPGKYNAKVVVGTSLGDKTSSSCATSFTVPTPGVSISKTVNGKESVAVKVNQEFTYKVTVKNTGQTDLKSLTINDDAPEGIVFTSANGGSISADGKKWTHAVASLAKGKSASFDLKAKAPSTVEAKKTQAKNTVCVNTGSIPGEPDDCDDAVVEIPENELRVCDLVTNQMITIKESAFDDKRHSKNPDACVRIQVCDLATSAVITIRKTEFDDQKHSRNLEDCDKIQVCDLESGDVVTIARHEFDSERHSKDAADCVPAVSKSKDAINLTQDGKDATKTVAKAGDRIRYTISVFNQGKVDAKVSFIEEIDDVLEYAQLNDTGGGEYDKDSKTLTWPDVVLAPGEQQSRIFTVQLDSAIPAGARGVSDASSYDCVMTNTFGNATEIKVDCPIVKGVESVVKELPTTGPRENMLFAGTLLAVVTYFYARSRQLKTEVRLIRRDLNSGILHQS